MKRILLFLCLSFASSGICSADSRPAIIELLQSPRPIDWTPYATSSVQQLRQTLEQIVKQPANLPSQIVNRALIEYGKFSASDDGVMLPEAQTFYQGVHSLPMGNNKEVQLQMAYVDSLRNSNTPEALTRMSEVAEIQNPALEPYAVVKMIDVMFPSQLPIPPMLDTPASKFEPKFGKPLRLRMHPELWLKAVEQAKLVLHGIRSDFLIKDQYQMALTTADRAIESAALPTNAEPKKSSAPQGKLELDTTSNEPQPANLSPQVTGPRMTDKAFSFRSQIIGMIVGVLIMGILLGILFLRNKRKPK